MFNFEKINQAEIVKIIQKAEISIENAHINDLNEQGRQI